MELFKLLSVDELLCVNCNRCIDACPVKFANDGSKDSVNVVENLCIGCGRCVTACTHGARKRNDDMEELMLALENGEKVLAFISSSIVSNFPGEYLNLNGWLKSLGIKAFFDVSFGAELTTYSYLEYIKEREPKVIISQQCPTINNYIQIYHPELIPYLAPIDSPTVHAMKMVKEFYPSYRDHKFVLISPCSSKKREFIETNTGDFNVSYASIEKFLRENNINLSNYPQIDYFNDAAERGAYYSMPGGTLKSIERIYPEIRNNSRVVTGERAYQYLKELHAQIDNEIAPFFIDILNCPNGCNGGTGTSGQDRNPDEMEQYIHQRVNALMKKHNTQDNDKLAIKTLNHQLGKFWEKGMYIRTYKNLSPNYMKRIKKADESEITGVLNTMNKFEQIDIKNCSGCGYNNCELMAQAIFNNLNKKENCRYYYVNVLTETIDNYKKVIKDKDGEIKRKDRQIYEHKQEIIEQSQSLLSSIQKMKNILD